jgi:SAM-dependent methyltransferase
MDKVKIKNHFNKLAPRYDAWKRRNGYYHECIKSLYASIIVPQSSVLELGSATGDLLAHVRPASGVGIDISEKMVELARSKYPDLRFEASDIDDVDLADLNTRFDYIILSNLVDYLPDILRVFSNVEPHVKDDGLIIVTTNNPLWEPMLRLGSRLGLRTPDSERNFLTNEDLENLAGLARLNVIKKGLKFFIPIRIPLVSSFINFLFSELPLIRRFCLVQYLVLKPRRRRPPLSCSVIIPCHDEEENITTCISRVPRMGVFTEIVVVDDGSNDATASRVGESRTAHRDKQIKLISYKPNRGKGNAVRTGFDAARGDVLMILDADMTVMPEDLPKFFDAIQEGIADFVNGTRMIYPMENQAMRSLNYVGNRVFNSILSWLMEQRVTDTLCGTKAILRSDYNKIQMGRCPWGDFDLLIGIARLRKKIIEMPVHYQARIAGKSKMKAFRHGMKLLRMCWIGFWDLKSFKKTRIRP